MYALKENIYIVVKKLKKKSNFQFYHSYWFALIIMETKKNNRHSSFEKCMPDPITEAVKAWAYLHPLLLSLCCLKIIEISYLGNTGSGLLRYSPQPN